jgi:hypothetical protein
MAFYVKHLDWDTSKLYQTHAPQAKQRRVTFTNGIQADLPLRNPAYSWLRNVLTLLGQINRSARVDIVNDEIVDLAVAYQGTVRMTEDSGGSLAVYLDDFAGPFLLSPGATDFLRLREYLRGPEAREKPLILVANDDRLITEVVLEGVDGSDPRGARVDTCEIDRSRLTKIWPNEADDVFAMARGMTCPLPTAAPACVPFIFPDDGCWVRAHALTSWLRQVRRIEPGKAWIYGHLQLRTPNHPRCVVTWAFHVAPVVRVGNGYDDLLVIDPSVSARAVPVADWKAALGDAQAIVQVTDASVYKQSTPCVGVFEGCGEFERNLKFFQACLLARAKGLPEPPPYACGTGPPP